MGEIIRFVPRAQFECKLNLEAYITFQREHIPSLIGPWESDVWDTTRKTEKRQRSKNGSRIYFRSWEGSEANSSMELGETLPTPFKKFAKAYMVEVIRERRLTELGRTLKALQALAAATQALRHEACVTLVDGSVLDYAAQLLNARFAYTTVWCYGRALERLASRIKEAGLTEWRLPWKQPFRYTQPPRNDRVNKKTDERTVERLPDVRAILSLADIYHQSNVDNDKIPAAFASIAMIAPERAGEILTLPVDCKASIGRNGEKSFGIRWKPLKGGQPKTNWTISNEGTELANHTVDYLIARGKKARAAANWYTGHPDQLYLPPKFEHLRDQRDITLWEAAQILGRTTVPRSCHKQKIFGFTHATGRLSGTLLDGRIGLINGDRARPHFVNVYSFDELENFILNKLPMSFPVVDASYNLNYHDALWCMPANILRPDAETIEHLPDMISVHQINHQLGANPGGQTVFSRHQKVDDEGEPWKISSHQFRHLLNTLGQSKYLSQELIAFWSGRKRVTQNAWYNHLPQEAFIEAYLKIDANLPELDITGPLEAKVTSISQANAISRKDAISYELGSTHKTRYGICRHDYALTPCPKDKDCISCGEHVFIKGDDAQIKEAQEQVELFSKGLSQAEAALKAGRFGAQRWIDLHKPKLDRWRLALALLTDPTIDDGTLITLPKPEVSQSKTGLAHAIRSADAITSDHGLLEMTGMV